MEHKQQKNVRLTEPQIAFLEAEAERIGITVSDLIRRIIDAYREGKPQ